MKKLLYGAFLSALVISAPVATMAEVDVSVGILLPPPIVFVSPPEVIVVPETYVYVVPDVDVDIFFYEGWWWRPWEGRWYRSRYYDSGWGYYQSVPSFYVMIPPGWRDGYREHRWRGHQWNYERIPHQQVQQNWRSWEKNRHWEKQQTWGVQGLKPQPRPQSRSQAAQPRTQAKPHVQKAAKPKRAGPQSGEVQPQHAKQPQGKAQIKSRPQKDRTEKGKQKNQDDKRSNRH